MAFGTWRLRTTWASTTSMKKSRSLKQTLEASMPHYIFQRPLLSILILCTVILDELWVECSTCKVAVHHTNAMYSSRRLAAHSIRVNCISLLYIDPRANSSSGLVNVILWHIPQNVTETKEETTRSSLNPLVLTKI
jgi:hypothetical protein